MKRKILGVVTAGFLLAGCAATQPTTAQNCFDKPRLEQRELKELKDAKASLDAFKAEYQDISAYVNFLNQYVSDYSKYIGAAASASTFIKFMPIPYAGQISSATNFGSKMTVLISNTSKSMGNLNNSIKTFEAKLALAESDPSKLQDAQNFADTTLSADITAAELSLIKLKDGTASMMAVSAMMKGYYDQTGDALSKAVNMFGKKEEAPKNAPNEAALKAKSDSFEHKTAKIFASFANTKNRIKNASVAGELAKEL
ncbi:MAG: hypothetical protein PHE67_07645 [Campylobacterales bacterium]|nr:hypothetical protein [Campylobacterales bacterium]